MVTIQLDKERHLKIDLNAMVKYEELTGKSLMSKNIEKDMNAKDVRALLFVSLVHEDPKLTIEQVGSFITTENMTEVAKSISNLWAEADKVNPI